MPLRLHGLPDAPSPEPDRPSTPDAEDDETMFKNLYTNLTTLITTLLSTRRDLATLYAELQDFQSLGPGVPATGPLRDFYNDTVGQAEARIDRLMEHAAELQGTIEEIADALVEWLGEEFESGEEEEEELAAMMEGEEVWQTRR
ncbi:MAG: hypothetical protein OHK93_004886 [Ramalina farinacea]|uniref:Uncharacterized protein n=1 Tax=Ramalina farinacea TaxID=258253 RepID=A0AA43QWX2_9LECA|nr:hypothetical protein [Ramalina farinacea]